MSELALRLIRENKKTKFNRLDLGNCELTRIPEELFQCEWIEKLTLSNKLANLNDNKRGRNNIRNIDGVNKLYQLKELSVAGLGISPFHILDISPLKDLISLEHINISHTDISDLSPLSNKENLQTLNASYTRIKDISSIKNLKKLKELNISGTSVSDLTPIKDLLSIQYLDISYTPVSDLSPILHLIKKGIHIIWNASIKKAESILLDAQSLFLLQR